MITPGQNNNMHRNSEILGCHVTQLEKIIHKCYTNIRILLQISTTLSNAMETVLVLLFLLLTPFSPLSKSITQELSDTIQKIETIHDLELIKEYCKMCCLYKKAWHASHPHQVGSVSSSLGYLTSCTKSKKNHQAIQEIQLIKESCNLIGREPGTPHFSQACESCTMISNHDVHHFRPFPAKTNDSILRKCSKTPFLVHFGPFWPQFWESVLVVTNGRTWIHRALSRKHEVGPITSTNEQ